MAAGKSIGPLFVPIKAKTDKYKKGLSDAEKRTKSFKANVTKAVKAVGVAFVGLSATAAYGMSKAIQSASDLEEVTSKFDTVFAGQEAQAEQWSKTLVDSYAMSTREARQYLSGVQDLLVPMGMQSKAAGEMSSQIVSLAADLGSFNNLQTADVIRDMESALTGEYQTMKKYGIVLNATTIQQRALQMGLADSKKELTAAMKAEAAYAMMIEGSTAAIGDMERTSGSYANQVKKLKAQIEDMSASIGNQLLPFATEVVKSMNKWAEANKGVLGGRFKVAMKGALVAMQAFENAWLGVRMVGQAAVVALSYQLSGMYAVIKNTILQPMNLMSKLLVKLGAIDVNPFDKMSEGLANLRGSSKDVAKDIAASMAATNERYAVWGAALDTQAEKEKTVANTVVQAEKDKVEAVAMTEAEKAKIRNKYADEYMEGLGLQYEFDMMMLDQRKAEMIAAGYEEKLVIDSLAEKYKELHEQKVLDSGTFFEGMSVGLSQLYDETMTYAELGAQTTKTLFTGVTKGIGKSVSQAIMSGQSMAKTMKAVMKNVAASIIESLVTVGIQRMLLKVLNLEATATEHVASSAAAAAETYGNSFKSAAAIPVVGWAMAPGVAAANLAAVLSGMAAAAKAGAGVAAIGHGGIENVPKESTYFLDEGERVLSPNQNADLMDFMGSGGGQNITFNVSAIDSEGMAEVVREKVIPALQDALELNSGDFTDSILEVA